MRFLLGTSLAAIFCLTMPTPVAAQAEASPPRSGMAGLLVGVAGVATGTFTLGSMPSICTGGISGDLRRPCAAGLGVVGGGLLVGGVVGLSLGIKRRVAYKAWRRRRAPEQRLVLLVPAFSRGSLGLWVMSRF
jgi:hypothetical protein